MSKLSTKDIRIFKREGYLVKRGILNPELMAQARDSLWEAAPPELDRNDPDTWIGPLPDRDEPPQLYGRLHMEVPGPG